MRFWEQLRYRPPLSPPQPAAQMVTAQKPTCQAMQGCSELHHVPGEQAPRIMSSQSRCQQEPRVGEALGCFQCIPFLCSWNPVADLGALESSIPLKKGQIPYSCRIPKVYWRPSLSLDPQP